jgi:hypothetical protein
MESKFYVIELVATRAGQNFICDESFRSLLMSEAVDEQSVECAFVLTQPWQVLDDEGIANEALSGDDNTTYDTQTRVESHVQLAHVLNQAISFLSICFGFWHRTSLLLSDS